jgi:hypothetical protein
MITSADALDGNGLRPFSIGGKGLFGRIESCIEERVDQG